jgi:Predicted signal transduction protein with a C-terminal ATPase domain
MAISGSIRNKLILSMLIAALLPFAASLFISQQFTQDRLEDKAVKDNSALLYQGKSNLLNYLQSLRFMSNSIYNNPQLMDMLNNRAKDYFSDNELYGTEQTIRYALQSINLSFADVQQVYLYAAQADRSYLYNTRMIVADQSDEPYRPRMRSSRQSEVHAPHSIGMYGKSFLQTAKPTVLTYQHALYDLFPRTELGILAVDFNTDTINRIGAQLYTRGEEQLYILDETNTVIYAPDTGLTGTRLEEAWVGRLREVAQEGRLNHFRLTDSGDEAVYIFDTVELDYLNWTIVKRIPDAFLYQTERQLLKLNLFTGLVFMIVSITVIVMISIKMTAPIIQLIGYINRIRLGQMNVDIRMNRNDELGTLALRFKSMMHTINELVLKEYKLEVANKTNELKALQAQVNPHFLNNALQSIGALALQQGNRDVYKLISLLGKMMRYSMNMDEPMVMLKSEMDYIHSFLKLQQQRFGNQFTADIAYEPETELLQIPKMIIQPIVENYFKHGFRGGNANNHISVRGYLHSETGRLHVEVTDNGFGMTDDQLAALRQRLEEPPASRQMETAESDHIGLANVQLRLLLYYSNDAHMSIEHARPQGLTVLLVLPTSHRKGADRNEGTHY